LDLSIDGAHGILFTITGGTDLTMSEVSEAARIITSAAHEDAKIIFGAVIDESMANGVRITVVATGFDANTSGFGRREESPMPSFFSSNANKFVPNTFIKREEEQPRPMVRPTFTSNPVPPKPSNDDELEIPAFIRKKME
jgi:cell division protein FtsZ